MLHNADWKAFKASRRLRIGKKVNKDPARGSEEEVKGTGDGAADGVGSYGSGSCCSVKGTKVALPLIPV